MLQISSLVHPRFHLNLALLLLLSTSARGYSNPSEREGPIQIAGRTEYRFYDSGSILKSVTNRFSLRLEGCYCSIEATENLLPVGRQVSNYYYMGDGTNSSFLTVFATEPPNTNAIRRTGLSSTSALVDIRPDPFPPMHTGSVGPVWLAYASGSSLRNSGEGRIPALVFMGPGWPPFGSSLPSQWVLSTSYPSAPVFLAEFATPEAFDFANALLKEFKGTSFSPLYRLGYTNAVYEVLFWTNVGSMRIPSHSRFSKYAPMLDTSSASRLELELTYDIYCEHAATHAASPDRLPNTVPRNTTIRDYRSAQSNSEPVVYVSSSGRIKTAREIAQLRMTSPQRSRFLIYVLFAFAALLPFSLVLAMKKGVINHKSKNQ